MTTTSETQHQSGSGGMPQLDPTYFVSQLFWLAVIMVVMYALMSKWVVPRIASVVEGRERKVSGDLAEAEKARILAQDAVSAYEKEMITAREASNAAIANSQREISDRNSSELTALDARLATDVAKAEAAINLQAQEIRAQLHTTVEELASLIAEKVLHVSSSPETLPTKMKA